jgi:hypothetical protein
MQLLSTYIILPMYCEIAAMEILCDDYSPPLPINPMEDRELRISISDE